MLSVNIWAVLVSSVISMILGYLWFGPLFGKQWTASMGWSEELVREKMKAGMAGMWKSYVIMFIAAFLMAFILARAVSYGLVFRGFSPLNAGLSYAIANWLGFVVPATLTGTLWEGKPWKWWFLIAGYFLVSMIITGLIVAHWR